MRLPVPMHAAAAVNWGTSGMMMLPNPGRSAPPAAAKSTDPPDPEAFVLLQANVTPFAAVKFEPPPAGESVLGGSQARLQMLTPAAPGRPDGPEKPSAPGGPEGPLGPGVLH